MIEIDKTEVCGWEAAIRGLRNPLNSWDKADTAYWCYPDDTGFPHRIGENDMDLCVRLCKSGTEHRKYMRMVHVQADVNAPLYWWKEYDTYKVGTTANSCSTMHRIASRHLSIDDFSHEHLLSLPKLRLMETVEELNGYIEEFNSTGDKQWWWQIIQTLPDSYNQLRTIDVNYEVLANMYRQRKGHKLDEWHAFCGWVESLPYSELITLKEANGG